MTIGFYIDTDNCFGCKTCQMSCANEHQRGVGVFQRRVREFQASDPRKAFISMSCNHCENPACMAACPVGAYSKNEEGAVIQDHTKCIGCRMCILSCPFHAPTYNEEEGATYKCDTCIDRRNAGLPPRCVASCPGANITFGEFDDVTKMDGAQTISAPTTPHLCAKLDESLTTQAFEHLDTWAETIDRGAVGY